MSGFIVRSVARLDSPLAGGNDRFPRWTPQRKANVFSLPSFEAKAFPWSILNFSRFLCVLRPTNQCARRRGEFWLNLDDFLP